MFLWRSSVGLHEEAVGGKPEEHFLGEPNSKEQNISFRERGRGDRGAEES